MNMLCKIGIVIISGFVGAAGYLIFGFPKDNAVEQVAEQVIKQETGLDIDLSPEDKNNP